jgi:phosphate transport system protein
MELEARHEYREELERLETRALDGLDLVVAALDRTVEAINHQDIELAELVVADDDVIDGRYLEIHQSILTLLATQAPVATDLRVIAALLHVMKNIERMGDQCVNVAKLIPIAGHEPPADERMLRSLVTMGGRSGLRSGRRSAPLRTATWRWRVISSARTTSSTTSTGIASNSRSRSATITTGASGR